MILPDQAQDFLKQMDIAKFHGVGAKKQLNAFMKWAFILVQTYWMSQEVTNRSVRQTGYELYRKARGIHNSPVKSIRKSIGRKKPTERSYEAAHEKRTKTRCA